MRTLKKSSLRTCEIEHRSRNIYRKSRVIEHRNYRKQHQLFYNIAGGILHQIRREKRTTISEVIVRGNHES